MYKYCKYTKHYLVSFLGGSHRLHLASGPPPPPPPSSPSFLQKRIAILLYSIKNKNIKSSIIRRKKIQTNTLNTNVSLRFIKSNKLLDNFLFSYIEKRFCCFSNALVYIFYFFLAIGNFFMVGAFFKILFYKLFFVFCLN